MEHVLQFPTPESVQALGRAMKNASLFVGDPLIPAIAAVRLEVSGSTLEVVATDRYRLFFEKIELPDQTADGCEALVDARDVKTVVGLLKNASSATVTIDGPKATFEAGLSTAAVALVEATFPRWRSLLPTGPEVAIPYIGFNSAFLADIGRVDTGPKRRSEAPLPVRVGLYGVKKPTLVTWVRSDDQPAPTLLLMPYGLA